MKKISQVMDYYYEKIYPQVVILEKERQQVEKNLKRLIFASVVLFIVELIFILPFFKWDANAIVFSISIPVLIYVFGYKMLTSNYVSNFKDDVIKKIIQFLDPNLKFYKNSHISQAQYKISSLFKQKVDRYDGNDLVTGVIDKTTIMFSDIHSEYQSRDSKGRTHWHTIFKGIFFIADFNKEFKGRLFVFPDVAEKFLGGVGSFFQSLNKSHGNLIKLDNPEFEKEFAVYGDDQIMGRYILTHSMMQRILELKKRVKVNIYLSFIGKKIYIAIAYNEDQFEPNPFKSLNNFKPIRNYIETMQLLINIVEDFKLNDRLWSKD